MGGVTCLFCGDLGLYPYRENGEGETVVAEVEITFNPSTQVSSGSGTEPASVARVTAKYNGWTCDLETKAVRFRQDRTRTVPSVMGVPVWPQVPDEEALDAVIKAFETRYGVKAREVGKRGPGRPRLAPGAGPSEGQPEVRARVPAEVKAWANSQPDGVRGIVMREYERRAK